MKLKKKIEKLEDVDEKYRDLYVADGDAFVLDAEGADESAALTQLRAENRKLAKEAGDRRKLQERWEKLGKTPDEIEELFAALEKEESEKLTRKGEWEKLRQQMVEKHDKELKALRDQIADKDKEIVDLNSSLESNLVDSQLTTAIAEHKGIPILLTPHAKKFVQVTKEEDGKRTVKVVNDKGEPRVNAKGEPLSIADLIGEMKSNEVFGRAFEGSGASGSGTPPGGGGGGGGPRNVKKSDLKTEKDRAAFVDAHGLDAYKSLPA